MFNQLCGSILSVMVVLGIVGNIVSFITWRAGKFCKNCPGATYLTALAFSDTCVLCTAGMKYAIQLLFAINLWDLNEVSCRLFHTTWHFFFLVSTWIVVSLTLERTVAVCQPLKAAARTSKKQEMIVVGILAFISLLLNLPFTIGAKMMPANAAPAGTNLTENTTISVYSLNDSSIVGSHDHFKSSATGEMVCRADPDSFYFKYENEYHNWFIDFVLLFAAPVGILTVCNTIILTILCRRRQSTAFKETQLQGKEGGVSGAMTVRVMILSLIQCISVGPFSVAALIPGVLPEVKAVDTVFVDRILTVLVLVWYLNNCVNFILYSVFGKSFRQDCADLFRKLLCSRSEFSSFALSSSGNLSKSSQLALVADSSLSISNGSN